MANSDNPKNGAHLQVQVRDWFVENYGEGFDLEVPIEIGVNPELVKEHRFDLGLVRKLPGTWYTEIHVGNM